MTSQDLEMLEITREIMRIHSKADMHADEMTKVGLAKENLVELLRGWINWPDVGNVGQCRKGPLLVT